MTTTILTSNDRLNSIKKLTIDHGTIVLAEHYVTQTETTPSGETFDNLPPRTIIKLVLNPAKGSNINVEIWLPDEANWNGRFVGQGNGGAAGSIRMSGLVGWLSGGWAVATTDMGTAPNPDSGIGNPEVWKDFGFRATHLMTVVSKQVVKAYYGRLPDRSYFNGGSTGGQQALQEAQRYPEDYDGIMAAVPAHCRTPLHAYFLWNEQIFNKCPFTESQKSNVLAAGNDYMAAREIPATAGKIVSDPRCNIHDIEAVIQLAMQKDPTLTQTHAEALKKLFSGPTHAETGERLFCGIPFGSSFDGAVGHLYLFQWVFGADKDLMKINFKEDIDTYTTALGPYLNAENPDLNQFEKRGGKMLMISGSADSCVPYHASIDYFEQVIEHFGSLEEVQSFLRFYIIPGMGHGVGSGPGLNKLPDLFDLLVNWREKNIAPEVIQAKRVVEGRTEIETPLYPYPLKTAWDPTTACLKSVVGPRGGVDRVAKRFLPPPAE